MNSGGIFPFINVNFQTLILCVKHQHGKCKSRLALHYLNSGCQMLVFNVFSDCFYLSSQFLLDYENMIIDSIVMNRLLEVLVDHSPPNCLLLFFFKFMAHIF